MLVKHDTATSIATDSGELHAKHGIFEVAEELGEHLIRVFGFHRHNGPVPTDEDTTGTGTGEANSDAKQSEPAPKVKKETAAAKKKREAAEAAAAAEAAKTAAEDDQPRNPDGSLIPVPTDVEGDENVPDPAPSSEDDAAKAEAAAHDAANTDATPAA